MANKTVTIPSDGMHPYWGCEINGKTYTYLAGATVSVPQEVWKLIEANKSTSIVEPASGSHSVLVVDVLITPAIQEQIYGADTGDTISFSDLPINLPAESVCSAVENGDMIFFRLSAENGGKNGRFSYCVPMNLVGYSSTSGSAPKSYISLTGAFSNLSYGFSVVWDSLNKVCDGTLRAN